jgi:hypothetical protein
MMKAKATSRFIRFSLICWYRRFTKYRALHMPRVRTP